MKRFGLAFLATLVTFLIVEVGLRLVPASLWKNAVRFDAPYLWLMYDPVLGWKNRPLYTQQEFHLNALGFRGPNITRHKPAVTIRIICIGDSRTFGTWLDLERIRYDNDYSSALEALLRRGTPVNT